MCRSDMIIPKILPWRKHDRHGLKLSWKEEISYQLDEEFQYSFQPKYVHAFRENCVNIYFTLASYSSLSRL